MFKRFLLWKKTEIGILEIGETYVSLLVIELRAYGSGINVTIDVNYDYVNDVINLCYGWPDPTECINFYLNLMEEFIRNSVIVAEINEEER